MDFELHHLRFEATSGSGLPGMLCLKDYIGAFRHALFDQSTDEQCLCYYRFWLVRSAFVFDYPSIASRTFCSVPICHHQSDGCLIVCVSRLRRCIFVEDFQLIFLIEKQ